MNLKRIRQIIEENAAAEGVRMSQSNWRPRLIGYVLGFILVALIAFWMAHHS